MGGTANADGLSQITPEEIAEELRREQEESRDTEFDAHVNASLSHLLAQYNDRDVEGISRHLRAIREALQDTIERPVEMLFGGSIDKHTYVDGLSDVDALVCLKDPDLAAKPPTDVLSAFRRILKERIRDAQVHDEGTLAATLSFRDGHEIQLLPAVQTREGFRISSPDGRQWIDIDPERFASQLTQANKACAGKLVPMIKLAKAVNDTLPDAHRLTGYHIEALGIEAFAQPSGRQVERNPKAMLLHFFEAAPSLVKQPIADRTGQSPHVDDYLGGPETPRRKAVSSELLRIARRMRRADTGRSLPQWKALFGDLA